MRRVLLWTPLAVFTALLGVVVAGLWKPADRTVRSALVGKPLPPFALPPVVPGKPGATSAGKPRLVNIFASWCVPCAAEAPQLMRLKRLGVAIDGVALKDRPEDTQAFLARYGDPYQRIGDDRTGRVQLAIGSSGVPETFVVGADGTILEQHIGDIRADEVDRLAALAKAGR